MNERQLCRRCYRPIDDDLGCYNIGGKTTPHDKPARFGVPSATATVRDVYYVSVENDDEGELTVVRVRRTEGKFTKAQIAMSGHRWTYRELEQSQYGTTPEEAYERWKRAQQTDLDHRRRQAHDLVVQLAAVPTWPKAKP